jgi:hypothetical protein
MKMIISLEKTRNKNLNKREMYSDERDYKYEQIRKRYCRECGILFSVNFAKDVEVRSSIV